MASRQFARLLQSRKLSLPGCVLPWTYRHGPIVKKLLYMAARLVHLDVPLLTVNAQGGLYAFPYKQKLVKSARTKGDWIVRVCLRARLLTFLD